jgi:hypothetical protein
LHLIFLFTSGSGSYLAAITLSTKTYSKFSYLQNLYYLIYNKKNYSLPE